MMKRTSLYLCSCVFFLFLTGCGHRSDPGEKAALAAKGYYDELLKGNYEDFVAGSYRRGPIPESYHRQLVTNAKMFLENQKSEHRGLREVSIVEAKADTATHTANAFLTFAYGDGTHEEVVVPMVEKSGRWMMK